MSARNEIMRPTASQQRILSAVTTVLMFLAGVALARHETASFLLTMGVLAAGWIVVIAIRPK